MRIQPKFRITSRYVEDYRAPLVLYSDTREAAIESLESSVYEMIAGNARLDTRQGHNTMSQCASASTCDNVIIHLLGDYVRFERLPEGFTP